MEISILKMINHNLVETLKSKRKREVMLQMKIWNLTKKSRMLTLELTSMMAWKISLIQKEMIVKCQNLEKRDLRAKKFSKISLQRKLREINHKKLKENLKRKTTVIISMSLQVFWFIQVLLMVVTTIHSSKSAAITNGLSSMIKLSENSISRTLNQNALVATLNKEVQIITKQEASQMISILLMADSLRDTEMLTYYSMRELNQ